MTGIKTATVEALTAEVRVLMVGSRQVTLSVYNQLDEADFEEIEPFGRVRPKDTGIHEIWVVGRDTEGNLVRSWLPYLGSGAYSDLIGWPRYDALCRDGDRLWLSDGDGIGHWIRVPDGYRGREVEAHDMTHRWEQLPLIVLAGLR